MFSQCQTTHLLSILAKIVSLKTFFLRTDLPRRNNHNKIYQPCDVSVNSSPCTQHVSTLMTISSLNLLNCDHKIKDNLLYSFPCVPKFKSPQGVDKLYYEDNLSPSIVQRLPKYLAIDKCSRCPYSERFNCEWVSQTVTTKTAWWSKPQEAKGGDSLHNTCPLSRHYTYVFTRLV